MKFQLSSKPRAFDLSDETQSKDMQYKRINKSKQKSGHRQVWIVPSRFPVVPWCKLELLGVEANPHPEGNYKKTKSGSKRTSKIRFFGQILLFINHALA